MMRSLWSCRSFFVGNALGFLDDQCFDKLFDYLAEDCNSISTCRRHCSIDVSLSFRMDGCMSQCWIKGLAIWWMMYSGFAIVLPHQCCDISDLSTNKITIKLTIANAHWNSMWGVNGS